MLEFLIGFTLGMLTLIGGIIWKYGTMEGSYFE